jgi:hypothetical protein
MAAFEVLSGRQPGDGQLATLLNLYIFIRSTASPPNTAPHACQQERYDAL